MANANGNGNVALANRIGTWASLVALGMYVMYIGQWVGAADEKFKDHDTVEETQQQIKERLTRLEERVVNEADKSQSRDEQILNAIKRLEEKIEEKDDDG